MDLFRAMEDVRLQRLIEQGWSCRIVFGRVDWVHPTGQFFSREEALQYAEKLEQEAAS